MKFLYKVKINPFNNSYHMQCTPLNSAEQKIRNIIYKGDKAQFKLFLKRCQANDDVNNPISKNRSKTFMQMIDDAENGDNYVYIWSHLLPKTMVVRESFLSSDSKNFKEFIDSKYYLLFELNDDDKIKIANLKKDALDIDIEIIQSEDDEEKKDLSDRKKDIQQQIIDISDTGE